MIPTLTGYVRPDKPDERDHPVPRSTLIAAKEVRNRYWIPGPILDQGGTSQCVAYSGVAALTCNPIKNKPHTTEEAIYNWCRRNDQWVGEDYDGTSVHALMKWLKLNGYVSSYRWAKTVQEVHAHLMVAGPAIFGTTWHWDMFTPDREGYLHLSGGEAGGHAWLARGGNIDRVHKLTGHVGALRKRGSWGRGWGQNGEAWISYPNIQRLIDDYGEVALPIEVKRAA
jgi:hypothetical protein